MDHTALHSADVMMTPSYQPAETPHRRRRTSGEIAAIREQAIGMLREGVSAASVARELHVPRPDVQLWAREAGVRAVDRTAGALAALERENATLRAQLDAMQASGPARPVTMAGGRLRAPRPGAKWTSPGAREATDEVGRLKRELAETQARQQRSAARAREQESGGHAAAFWELAYLMVDLLPDDVWPRLLAGERVRLDAGRLGAKVMQLQPGEQALCRLIYAHRRGAEVGADEDTGAILRKEKAAIRAALKAIAGDERSEESARVREAMGRSARVERYGDE